MALEWAVQQLIDEKMPIELFFLSSYLPELNPDEYLNCDLKAQVYGEKPVKNCDGLETRVRGTMMKFLNRLEWMKMLFQKPENSICHLVFKNKITELLDLINSDF